MSMTLPIALLGALMLAGCATSAPPPAPEPTRPELVPRASRPPLPPDALPFERRLYERDSEILVVPIAAADPGDADRALGLSQLLVHAIDVQAELIPRGIALDDQGRPLGPPELAARAERYFAGGRLARRSSNGSGEPLVLTIWLMDRAIGRVTSRAVPLDLPLLIAPRNALADLMAETPHPPSELERADMTWYEDLDAARLDLAGALVHALARSGGAGGEQLDALVARAEREAPYSFVVAAATAERALSGGAGCTRESVDRLAHLLSLHREVPFTLEAFVMSCVMQGDLDPSAPKIPAWSRRSSSHCRIGAKGMTSVASDRRTPRDGVGGHVTGLGGLYRGDTCDAGYAVMHHAEEDLGPPLVRASLELEAAFYFYGVRDLEKSTRWFRRARATATSMADPPCPIALLGAEAELGLADLALEQGRHDDAERHLEPARVIAERCGDWRMRGRILNSRALLEQGRSRFDRALELFGEAKDAFNRVADALNVAVTETNLGVTWLQLGSVDRAVPLLDRALAQKRKARSEGGVSVLLENLGVAELMRGDYGAAAAHFEAALDHTRDDHTIAMLEIQLARIALAKAAPGAATEHLGRARDRAARAHSPALAATVAQTEAAVRRVEGDLPAARGALQQALGIRRAIGDRAGEGIVLSLLMSLSADMKRPAIGILYGKLAVQAHQEVRGGAETIGRDVGREFLATRAHTYRQLADLLISEGRLVEAERVVALLKEDEVDRWTRDAASTGRAKVPLTTAERDIDARYQEIAGRVMRLGREHGELAARWPRTELEEERLEELRAALEVANQRFNELLGSIAESGPALERSDQLSDLKEGTSIGADLGDLGPGFVAVYTLVSDRALHLIVVSADAQVARTVPVARGVLHGVVAAFRESLQDPRRDPRSAARALYDYIVAPIEGDLTQAGATTILWSLDGALRYVPIGALFDGERWVVERWRVAVFTPASRARLKDNPQPDWRVLALGVTSAHPPFPALPAVADELAGLVDRADTPEREGVLPGLGVLDGGFTKAFMLSQLTRRWPVVHLASHFSFQPGDKDASYLLLGDGSRLTVGELERLPNVFRGVDLLTLSACNTGTGDLAGDGTEVESFAVLAQRKGARAVFASLWPVADHSTSVLMRRFYALRSAAPDKLAALRSAQLELLSAKLVPPPDTTRARPLELPGARPSDSDPSEPALDAELTGWRHPYYWAPFILIGNVR